MISKQQIKYIRALHQKKQRDQSNIFIAEGLNIVREALQHAPGTVQMLIYTTKSLPHIKDLHSKFPNKSYSISDKEFQQISTQKTPQEVLALLEMKKSPPPDELENELLLILDRIQDPGNMGTIIRLADWFGVSHLVCSEDTVDCYNPKVVQSAMGASLRVKISYVSLPGYLLQLKKKSNVPIYGTSLSGSNIYQVSLGTPGVVILGNEARGISEEVEKYVDENLMIPNFSTSDTKTESLNVAVAAAIACSEFRRKKA